MATAVDQETVPMSIDSVICATEISTKMTLNPLSTTQSKVMEQYTIIEVADPALLGTNDVIEKERETSGATVVNVDPTNIADKDDIAEKRGMCMCIVV